MVAQCLDVPKYRCHTSYDTNWSLNAVMVKRSTMLNGEVRGSVSQASNSDLVSNAMNTRLAIAAAERR